MFPEGLEEHEDLMGLQGLESNLGLYSGSSSGLTRMTGTGTIIFKKV